MRELEANHFFLKFNGFGVVWSALKNTVRLKFRHSRLQRKVLRGESGSESRKRKINAIWLCSECPCLENKQNIDKIKSDSFPSIGRSGSSLKCSNAPKEGSRFFWRKRRRRLPLGSLWQNDVTSWLQPIFLLILGTRVLEVLDENATTGLTVLY